MAFRYCCGGIIEKAVRLLNKSQAVGNVTPPLFYFEPFGCQSFIGLTQGSLPGLFSPRQTAINLLGYLQ